MESDNAYRSLFSLEAGFTLIELLMTIFILGIILAFGIPSFQNLFENNRVRRVNDDFITAVNLARSEAISRELPAGGRVVLCERNAAANGCSGDADWSDGVLVLEVDAVGNVQQIIRAWDPIPTVTLTAGAAQILFTSDGRADPAVGFNVDVNGESQDYCLRPTGSLFKGGCP